MPTLLQCYRQPEALHREFKISVPSVNDHFTTVDIFRKFYENGSCIHAIYFYVIMIEVKILDKRL